MQKATPTARLATTSTPATAMAGSRYTSDPRLSSDVRPSATPPSQANIRSAVSPAMMSAGSLRQSTERAQAARRCGRVLSQPRPRPSRPVLAFLAWAADPAAVAGSAGSGPGGTTGIGVVSSESASSDIPDPALAAVGAAADPFSSDAPDSAFAAVGAAADPFDAGAADAAADSGSGAGAACSGS